MLNYESKTLHWKGRKTTYMNNMSFRIYYLLQLSFHLIVKMCRIYDLLTRLFYVCRLLLKRKCMKAVRQNIYKKKLSKCNDRI